ncbi:MAG: hypothetical protein HON14_14195 [Rhodospirillaceae bacterium]|nr:hypothetical protein [Rhodospirillaceae bacterium]
MFTWAWWEATRGHDVGAEYEPEPWPLVVSQFPLVAAIPGLMLVFFAMLNDGRVYLAALREHGGFGSAWAHASEEAVLDRAIMFFGYLFLMIMIMLVIGQKLALPLFIFTYLIRWGSYNWRVALGYAAGGWLFLVIFYDRIMHLFWYPSWLDSWLPEMLPEWFPPWLFF